MLSASFSQRLSGVLASCAVLNACFVSLCPLEAQEGRGPLEVILQIVEADAKMSSPAGLEPWGGGPILIGLAPGATATDAMLRLLEPGTLRELGLADGSRESALHFRAGSDFVEGDGLLVEIESVEWGEEAITVGFTSFMTRQLPEAGSKIWAHASEIEVACPEAQGGEWALLSWTSLGRRPVEPPQEIPEQKIHPDSLSPQILLLSTLLAEQSTRIGELEAAIAELRREVRVLSAGRPAPGALAQMGADPDNPYAGPGFTPFTVAPTVKNREEVSQALRQEYPRLMAAGLGGTVTVWLFIDEEGVVRRAQVIQSSGFPMLDAAALKVADVIQFTPALNYDKPVPVWISYPISFTVRN